MPAQVNGGRQSARLRHREAALRVIPSGAKRLRDTGHDRRPRGQRAAETLAARKDDLAGLAVATDEGIEAYLLYRDLSGRAEVSAFRSLIDDGGARLAQLLSGLQTKGLESVRFPRVHPAKIPAEWLERLGFRPAGRYRLYAGMARPG